MFTLDNVVPWGRSFDEYRRMFALSDADLTLNILGCGDGPASFNAEATRRGASVISCDPIYQFTAVEIRGRIAATYDQIIEQTRANAAEFVWTTIPSVEELGRVRMAAMRTFLDDYDAGKAEGRYVEAALPALPFGDAAFDLALCSHFLFLYTAQLGEDFHRAAIRELCRVGREVRVFPLLALGGQPSPYVEIVADEARAAGHDVLIEPVPYEFQRGGNKMMKLRSLTSSQRSRTSSPAPEHVPSLVASSKAAVSGDVTPNTGEDAFYDQVTPETFQANIATTGPWDPALQHGGPPAALLGRALELRGGPGGMRIARLAFDFFGPVPVSQVSVRTAILRGGTKIQLSEATMSVGGRVVLRASASHLLAEPGRSPVVPDPFVVPRLPLRETAARFSGMERFPYGDAVEWRFVDGGFSEPGPATVWTRCRIPLVRGSALTGLQRVLIMVDAANGISAVLPFTSWTFVPIDLTVTAHRLPDAEWVGMSSRTTLGADGIGTTDTVLFDADGVFGRSLQTLYVTPK